MFLPQTILDDKVKYPNLSKNEVFLLKEELSVKRLPLLSHDIRIVSYTFINEMLSPYRRLKNNFNDIVITTST